MQKGILNYEKSELAYTQWGVEGDLLLCFHGFSEDGSMFQPIISALSCRYQIIAIDFPFHGETKWNEKRAFDLDDLVKVVEELMRSFGKEKISLMGFSMGGRMSLTFLEQRPELVNKIYLIAADGIKTNKLFNTAVYPSWGRRLFKLFVNRPKFFFFCVSLARRSGRISKFLDEFSRNHFKTREKRMRLYNTWMTIRNFIPDLLKDKELLNKHEIPLFLYFGQYDEVIPPEAGRSMAEGVNDVDLHIVKGGHLLVNERLSKLLKEKLC